ncbi:response regulator [Salinarimonas soli]|uniref:Response regulator n=1 Tax=Salinarimonas soli TaxID=1638099 RepID=A0A5B2VCV1_9HYPH|nr:response regulator [Salinarimonas soli]KAA2236290.1 response regulator [Salinarimonas soli]
MQDNIPSVLIVDDQPKLARLVRELFLRLGFHDVDTVGDASEAIDALKQKRYGLMLVDLELEPVDGIQLLRQIRATKEFQDVGFILTEATVTFENVSAAHFAGVDAFLLKPYDLPLLKSKLKIVLRKAARRQRYDPNLSMLEEENVA